MSAELTHCHEMASRVLLSEYINSNNRRFSSSLMSATARACAKAKSASLQENGGFQQNNVMFCVDRGFARLVSCCLRSSSSMPFDRSSLNPPL